MAAAWDGCGGVSISGTNRSRIAACAPLLRRVAAEQGKDPVAVFAAAVKRFKGDPDVVVKRLGLPVFLSQLEVWCAEVPEREREGEREDRIRKIKLRIEHADREAEMSGDNDARRGHWERQAEKLRAELEQLTTMAA